MLYKTAGGRALMIAALVLISAIGAATAAQDKETPAEGILGPEALESLKAEGISGAEPVESLKAELEEAQRAWLKRYREAETEEARAELRKNDPQHSPLRAFEPRFLDLAKRYASEPTAIDAVQWLADTADAGPIFDEGLALVERHHVEDPKMAQLCETLVYRKTLGIESFMRAVATKSPHHEVQGQAYLSLARYLKNLRKLATYVQEADEQNLSRLKEHNNDEVMEWLQTIDSAKSLAQVEALCERVIAEYGDVEYRHWTLADTAAAMLFELNAIGKTAPEIEGEDIDGKRFKLSDYRGKVVALDFWGHW